MIQPGVPKSLCADGATTNELGKGIHRDAPGYRKDAQWVQNTIGYSGDYWSSSPNANNSNNAWIVNFNNGNANNNNRNNNNHVRLVRSGEWLGGGVDFRGLYAAWLQCRRRKGKAPQAQAYEARLLDNLVESVQVLQAGQWQPRPPVCFMVDRPKAREIYAAHFSDRVIHHWLVPRLEQLYEPIFIHDLYSNRKGKGTHLAVARLRHFMRSQQQSNGGQGGYYLQLDIHNFFNSIHRPTLFSLLQQRLRKSLRKGLVNVAEATFLRDLCHRILKQPLAEQAHVLATAQQLSRVPPHKQLANAPLNVGLPIGNLTSQCFANVYLNELDQFVKHTLKCRHYLRYVDDFVLLHPDADQLSQWQVQITEFLGQRLRLRLKPDMRLRPVGDGADFLGYIIRPHYTLVRRRVVGNLREKLQAWQVQWLQPGARRLMLEPSAREQLRAILASYMGHFNHANSHRLIVGLFKRFSWLGWLFRYDQQRLTPLWEPLGVSSYQSQIRHFQRTYPHAVLHIQCGYRWERYAPGKGGSSQTDDTQSVRELWVQEQGYLKGGLKRRVSVQLSW